MVLQRMYHSTMAITLQTLTPEQCSQQSLQRPLACPVSLTLPDKEATGIQPEFCGVLSQMLLPISAMAPSLSFWKG
jgi:hypothetical protein